MAQQWRGKGQPEGSFFYRFLKVASKTPQSTFEKYLHFNLQTAAFFVIFSEKSGQKMPLQNTKYMK